MEGLEDPACGNAQYDHDLVQSVNEVSHDDVDATMDQITNNKDG